MGKWNKKRISPFGRKLERLLAEKGMNQADLARETGVSRQTIHQFKYSKYPRHTTVLEVSKALEVPISSFYDEIGY